MICARPTEASLIEQLSERNAGFKLNDGETDSMEIVGSMIDQLGRHPNSTLCLCEGEVHDQAILVNDAEWIDVEFEVAIDSGSIDRECSPGEVTGYMVEASPGSRAGQGFIVGSGARAPYDGQSVLNLPATNNNTMATTFQGAKVSRPLMSVGRHCGAGMHVKADVLATHGSIIVSFERQSKGLYAVRLKLKKPAPGFGRQG